MIEVKDTLEHFISNNKLDRLAKERCYQGVELKPISREALFLAISYYQYFMMKNLNVIIRHFDHLMKIQYASQYGQTQPDSTHLNPFIWKCLEFLPLACMRVAMKEVDINPIDIGDMVRFGDSVKSREYGVPIDKNNLSWRSL